MQQSKSGDHQSLSKLLLHFAPQFRSYCESLISPKWQSLISADDVLQESYTEVFLAILEFRGSSPNEFFSWVKKICRNNYFDTERSLNSQKRGGGKVVSLNKEDSLMNLYKVVGDDQSPRWALSKQESIKRLAKAIGEIPKEYADVILGIDIEGMGVADIAERKRCSVGAIYMRRTRGLRALKKILGSSVEF